MANLFNTKVKFRLTILILVLGGFAAAIAGWFIADRAGAFIAQANAERAAIKWGHKAISLLEHGENTFSYKNVTYDDKFSLAALRKNSDAYRFVMFGPDGKIFWSSKESKIGKTEQRDYFQNIVMAGKVYTKNATKTAAEVDDLLKERGSRALKPQDKRQVTEIYVPIMRDGVFVGAFEIYSDVTEMFAWADKIIKPAAVIAGIAILAVFSVILALFISFGKDKQARERVLENAKTAAESAEREAREMHREVDKINQEMALLNKDLSDNVKILKDTQDKLVKSGKMAQLGQLTATVAHEIRNPLGAVRTSSYLVERKCADKVPGLEKPFARIKNGIARCDNIITELLDFARSNSLKCEEITVDNWVLDIVREQAGHLPEVVRFQCQMGLGDNFKADMDIGFMERVMINLLSNASEAMVGKADKPDLSVTSQPLIAVATKLTERGVEISVSDNGPGISEEVMEKILEPLFTTKNFGVGLGLPAVEKILVQHNGGLDIQSTPGEGATFIAWFPQHQREETSRAA